MNASEFLRLIIESLVHHTDQIEITETNDELWTLLTLRIAPEDMGTVIGRGGKTIEAIRTVIRVYGSKTERRINLRIVEDRE